MDSGCFIYVVSGRKYIKNIKTSFKTLNTSNWIGWSWPLPFWWLPAAAIPLWGILPASPFLAHFLLSLGSCFLRHTLLSTTLWWIHWMQSKLRSVATKGNQLHDPGRMLSRFLHVFVSAFRKPLNFLSSPTSATPLPVLDPQLCHTTAVCVVSFSFWGRNPW